MREIARNRLARILGILLLAGFIALVGWRRSVSPVVAMDRWEVDDLINHLRARGLEFRAVPVGLHGPSGKSVYLTTTDKPREQLNRLFMVPESIADWEGTVYCSQWKESPSLQEGTWLPQFGGYGERQGPFFFFGDPALRARINAALRAPRTGRRWRGTSGGALADDR
jgi:hypothetical protein